MTHKDYDPEKHHRRSIRLKGYDYSRPGAYFLTICTHNRDPMFGQIADGEMVLNRYGRIVLSDWRKLPDYHPYIELGAFVVMPNHVHGIVMVKDTNLEAVKRRSVSDIMRGFKTFSSQRINRVRGATGPVWQRDYWEHVIRNQEVFKRIHDYITTNPLRWHLDKENPDRIGEDDFDRWLDDI